MWTTISTPNTKPSRETDPGDVYQRLHRLRRGQTVFVDYDDTLFFHDRHEANTVLIQALKTAQERGVLIELWTHASFEETIGRVGLMREHGLNFDDVHCGIPKGDLIIDNLAVQP